MISVCAYSLDGIIPTRVGTSQQGLCCFLGKQDHPHACGDKEQVLDTLYDTGGSSPRVWGQASTAIFKPKTIRIIPTRVGTRDYLVTVLVVFEDHPHACGDKVLYPVALRNKAGSSPRVWGQVRNYYGEFRQMRIIPTRVGTRLFGECQVKGEEDHPHACGDKLKKQLT